MIELKDFFMIQYITNNFENKSLIISCLNWGQEKSIESKYWHVANLLKYTYIINLLHHCSV